MKMRQLTLIFVLSISKKSYYPFSSLLEPKTCHKYSLRGVWRKPTADLWPNPWKIHVKGINFIGKLQGGFMFSKSELLSQVLLKDIDPKCRKFFVQNRTFADQLFWNSS